MSVIEASSGTYRSRVDGTIVLSVEIEPRFRQQALELFGMPGTPMALAALKVGRAAEPEKPTREPIGPLCSWTVMRCREEPFRRFVAAQSLLSHVPDAIEIANMICNVCGIESRKELDTDKRAAEVFERKFRKPYAAWMEKQEQTA